MRSTDARARVGATRVRGVGAERVEIDLLAVQREAPGLELREVEQVADQALQAVGLGEHDVERRLLLVGVVEDPVGDQLHVALDRRQRGAQLVRDAHQEVALVLVRLPQLARHPLEARGEQAELVAPLAAQLHVVHGRGRCARSPPTAP